MEGRNLIESGVLHQYGNISKVRTTRRNGKKRRWSVILVTVVLTIIMSLLGSKIVHSSKSIKGLKTNRIGAVQLNY